MAARFSVVPNEEDQEEDAMKQRKLARGWLLSLMCAVAVSMLVGCVVEGPPPPPPGPPVAAAGYDYYYYPDEEVYFYPATGVYFWFGGGGWRSGRSLPSTIVLHDRVSVNLNTRRPYEQHNDIRTRYPAHRAAPRPEESGEHGGR
jgi:hypothetical protein